MATSNGLSKIHELIVNKKFVSWIFHITSEQSSINKIISLKGTYVIGMIHLSGQVWLYCKLTMLILLFCAGPHVR